jgi:pimeloyl-[acyl-carrier protein] methyl ester esterase
MDGTGDLFEPFIAALDGRIDTQVIRYPSDTPQGYEVLEVFVRERLPKDRAFVLLGESFSGLITISIASNPPVNLAGVVLCCTFASNPVPALSLLKQMTRFLPIESAPGFLTAHALMGRDATPALRTALNRAMASVSPQVMRARAAEVLSIDYSHKLASIDRPLLYLRATKDRVVPRRCGDKILRECKHAQLVEINAPHFLLQTRATHAATAIMQFFDSIP